MPDTHAIARNLTAAGIPADHADAIADAITNAIRSAIRDAAKHGEFVTPDMLRADIAALEARLTWRFAGALLAQTAVIAALIRMLG